PAQPTVTVTFPRRQVDLYLEENEHVMDTDGDERQSLYRAMDAATGSRAVKVTVTLGEADGLRFDFGIIRLVNEPDAYWSAQSRANIRMAREAVQRIRRALQGAS